MELECPECGGTVFNIDIDHYNEEIRFKCCECGEVTTAHFVNNDGEYDFCYWFS